MLLRIASEQMVIEFEFHAEIKNVHITSNL